MNKSKLFTAITEMIGDKLAGYDSIDNLLQEVVSTGEMAALLNTVTGSQLLAIIGKNSASLYDDIVKVCCKSDVMAEISGAANENVKNKVFNSESSKDCKIMTAEAYVKKHPEIFGDSESKQTSRKSSARRSNYCSGGCGVSSGYSYSGGCGGSSSYSGGC